jgi:tetratricopeptide (TPR) repeat protein
MGPQLRSGFLLAVLLLALSPSLQPVRADDIKPKATSAPSTPAFRSFEEGQTALTANDFTRAESCFVRSVQMDPNLVDPLLGLAEIRMRKGEVAGAEDYLRKATVLAPKNAKVSVIWGHYLFFRKDYPEAEKAFKAAILLDPNMERAHSELGDFYLLARHDPGAAILSYKRALAINPGDSRVHYTLANALAESGSRNKAQAELEEAARFDPHNASLQNSIGNFYLHSGKFDLAQRAFTKAISIDPHFVAAKMGEGDVLVATKNLDGAIASYQGALQIAPESTAALLKIAALREIKGQWLEAEQTYRQALAQDPKLALAANNLAWVLNEHRNASAEALKWAATAVQSVPNDFNFQDTYGWVLRSNHDLTQSLVALKKANSLAPQVPQVLYHLGVLYQETSQPQLAIRAFAKALSISKNFDEAADAQTRLTALRASAHH